MKIGVSYTAKIGIIFRNIITRIVGRITPIVDCGSRWMKIRGKEGKEKPAGANLRLRLPANVVSDVVRLIQLCRCLSQLELPRQWQEVEVLQHQEPQVAGLSGEVIAHKQVYDYGLALRAEQVETPG